MSTFRVTPGELAAAGGSVSRGTADLGAARGTVLQTAGAAAGTPAAGAYDALVADAGPALQRLQTTVDELAHALGRAASNYASTDSCVATSYLPGGPR